MVKYKRVELLVTLAVLKGSDVDGFCESESNELLDIQRATCNDLD